MENVVVPNIRYFMVTWGVGGEFGGMTSMCLARARSLAQFAGVRAPVLTFEIQPDYREIIDTLMSSGHLIDGMEIRNIYHYYRSAHLDSRKELADGSVPRLEIPQHDIQTQTVRDGNGQVFCRVIRSLDAEKEFRREYWRRDESVFLTETTEYGNSEEHHELRLLDRSGRTVGLYKSREDFFRAWMLELTDDQPSVFVADSVKTTRFTGMLRARHVMKMAVMHNSHIAGGGEPLRGRLAMGRRDVTLQSQRWDGIFFLTERHRQDFMDRFGHANNLFVLSNPSTRAAEYPHYAERESARGVMVCRLDPVKNVRAAIEIIYTARQSIPSIRLDIYGNGKQRPALQERIDELGMRDNVILHGHVPNAAEQFRTAVFSLLTSQKEGQPLALLESQGRGCTPVAFQIRYGPDDVIDDGQNGFLVAEGDVSGAAERVVGLCSNDNLARKMSQSAWESSERYEYPEVLKRFGAIVEGAWEQRSSRLALARMAFRVQSLTADEGEDGLLTGTFTWKQTSGPPAQDKLALALQLIPRRSDERVWINGDVLSRSDGRLDVQFRIAAHYLDASHSWEETHDAFVIANSGNILFRQAIEHAPDLDDNTP